VKALSGILLPPSRDYANDKPVGNEIFAAYRRQYSYDRTDLIPRIDVVDDSHADWRVEKVSFAAAYGPERVITYLMLPKKGKPPYQPVIFMPAAAAWDQRTSPALTRYATRWEHELYF
jgi:hypothetical protein